MIICHIYKKKRKENTYASINNVKFKHSKFDISRYNK